MDFKNALHLDFETRSESDLTKVGSHIYAEHPSTDILCAAFALGDEEPKLWTPGGSSQELLSRFKQAQFIIAHNAPFERNIWNGVGVKRYGWPGLPISRSRCTMAMGYAMGLPGSLEGAAAALGITERKDSVGHRIMLQLSQPKDFIDGKAIWYELGDYLEKYAALYRYCMQDLRVERMLGERMLDLSPREWKIWELDQKINDRGIFVDVKGAKGALAVAELEQVRLNAEMKKLTNNAVSSCSAVTQLTDFLKWNGVKIEGVAAADIVEILALEGLPEVCKKAVLLRREFAKSSVAKLKPMIISSGPDQRVRGLFQYHGAQQTGRWAGRRLQPQNLPRPKLKHADIEKAAELFGSKDPAAFHAQILDKNLKPLHIVADCLRAFLSSGPGSDLMCSDLANIEGRMAAWIAGEEWKLKAFEDFDKGVGPDTYILAYSKSFHTPIEQVTKDQRQIGKVEELSLQFQGGKGAFKQMGKNYGVTVSDDEAEVIKVGWREAHPKIVSMWYDLERAAICAVQNPGRIIAVRPNHVGVKIQYLVSGSFLFCRLPSGRAICYAYPKVQPFETPWGAMKDGLTYWGVSSQGNKWELQKTYGGSLFENIVQASSRDILADGMLALDALGYNIVLHVHDEIGVEEKKETRSLEEVERVMCVSSPWAVGLPIAAKGWRGVRYRKD